MGFNKNWDVVSIVQQINRATYECASPLNDGFTSWQIKQDLYQIKEILDAAIRRCPDFGTIESDWIREQDKKKVIKYLKDEN
jgi:hypothetical protein